MQKVIEERRGICIKATDDLGQIVGMVYAQQENPINGKEGLEKWVIVIAAVKPDQTGSGVGTGLLKAIEEHAKNRGATKMFVYTNKDDEEVVHFYQKNNYEDAGWIKNYQYGKDNSAVFLLKYL
jgi:ribosomal protein S18 acetylase RimI-like enzyme